MGIWEAIFLLVLSFALSSAFTPKVQGQKPNAFEEFDFPQADEGTPQCVFFGECWTGDWMVLDVGDYRTSAIKKPSGGKK